MAIIDDFEAIAKGMKGDLKPPAKPPCWSCSGAQWFLRGPNLWDPCLVCNQDGSAYPPVPPSSALSPASGWSRPLCHDCNGRGADTYGNICQRCSGKGHS